MARRAQGREAQRARTRKAIVRAAAALLARGERPGLPEIAAEAGVSRATTYRYFPGLDALFNEAAVDMLVPEPEALFEGNEPQTAAERLALVDGAFDKAIREGEVPLRLMLARILERSARPGTDEPPLRQNRRVPLIEKALEPLGPRLGPQARTRLVQALAMIVGTEGFIVLNDVLGLDRKEAEAVRRWAIAALLEAALAKG